MLGWGGQRYVEKTFGWDRKTIRKGQQERDAGEPALDGRCRSGCKKAEEHCPRLLDDIVDILDTTGQTDPTFRSTRIYTPITAREVRRRLLEQKGYTDSQLIGERSLRTKLNMLGYRPQRIRKCKPHKRLPETDAIFEEIHRVNAQADEQPGVLRLSFGHQGNRQGGTIFPGRKKPLSPTGLRP